MLKVVNRSYSFIFQSEKNCLFTIEYTDSIISRIYVSSVSCFQAILIEIARSCTDESTPLQNTHHIKLYLDDDECIELNFHNDCLIFPLTQYHGSLAK